MDVLRDTLSPTTLVVAALVVVLSLVYYAVQNRGIPPGPMGLPYFGIWPFLDNRTCHLKLQELGKKYGDVFSFTCSGTLYVNFGSIAAVREAHVTNSDCFEGRPEGYTVAVSVFGNGVFYENGESWKALRKFVQQQMKVRGTKAITDTHSSSVCDVIDSTVQELKAMKGGEVNIIQMMTDKFTTTLRLTLFGEEGLNDKKVREICHEYETVWGGLTPLDILLIGKFARYCILPLKTNCRMSTKSKRRMDALFHEIIRQHRATYKEDNLRDIIDEFIKERNDKIKKNDPTAKYLTDDALVATLVLLVGDGVVTVSFFINIMIKSLVEHPEEQEKIYEEIAEVVGPERLPSIDDKPRLPYLNAFIQEVTRMSDFMPFLPLMECSRETTVRGYRIPKGAITVVNYWSAHQDPLTYEEPEKFNPSRFLSKEGKRRAELPIIFGVGKRACLGEGFTQTQIFLFLAAIIKNFQLSVEKKIDSATLFEMLISGDLKIRVKPRRM